MDREFLKDCLERGLSLPEIGRLTDRDPSTVGYWVAKRGLVANGKAKYAPRGGLERRDLECLVKEGATLQEMAAELDRSVSTIRHWLKKFGIERPNGWRREAARAAAAAGLKRIPGLCPHHGASEFLIFADGRSRCARCNTEGVARRRRQTKETLVEEAGGRCQVCGYDRYVGALQFHHRDPEMKQFAVSRRGYTISMEKAREEAKKCDLLCANCHAEVEAGIASLNDAA